MATFTATSCAMLSAVKTHTPCSAGVSRSALICSFSTRRLVKIECMAEPPSSSASSSQQAGFSAVPTPPPQAPIPPPKPKVSTSFGDVFAFGGPAPETINGRLAMLGFVTALGVELWTGNDVTNQLDNGGINWFIVASVLFTVASLVPMFKGVTAESKSTPFFSSTAETWNGRAAMIGLVALVITEVVKGSPLV